MGLSLRPVLALGAALSIAVPAALLSGIAAAATSRHDASVRAFGVAVGPPLRRAKPARSAPEPTAAAGSNWRIVRNPAPFSPGTMLLASDGSVLVHSEPVYGGTSDWYRLTPDSTGSYTNGTWTKIASMPSGYAPLYFASAILPDGRMIVEGGEYNVGNAEWQSRGAIYSPFTNKWFSVQPPPGWTNIGDAQSDVLANGTFMMAQACQDCLSASPQLSNSFALFNATGLNWLSLSNQGKNDPNDEESWTLEPSGQLLTVDTWLTPSTELFTPQTLTWSNAGNTPTSPVNQPAAEIGPQAEMPGGNVFVVGAGSGAEAPNPCTSHNPASTALYNYAQGSWSAGPKIPALGGLQYDSADGPASTLPDGDVLFDASPCVYNAPLAFFIYHPASNTITQTDDVLNAANDSTYYTRMLNLPNGQILFNDGSNRLEVYTAGGNANPAWAPTIYSMSSTTLTPGGNYTLAGTQLAGLDQGSAYGDDVQDNTNFPIVRVKNSATGAVTYARTSDWSSVSVAPGAYSSTRFSLPAGTPSGASTLVVVANGIASSPVSVTVK